MSCGCSKGSKCGCRGMKDISYNCGCGDMSHNYARDMSHNYVYDMCHNYVYDMSHNYVYDMCNNNYVYDMCNNNYVYDISCNQKKDVSYNVTSSHCSTCNKLLTNSMSLYSEVCDCSINYLIYTGDISHAEIEIEFEYSDGPTGPMGPMGPMGVSGEIGPTGPAGPSIEPYNKTYLSICSMKEQYILIDDPIVFEEQTALMGHCKHVDESSEIYVWKSGYYLININIYTLSPCQFSIIKNMLYIVKGSTVGGISGSLQNSHTFIIHITDDDMVSDLSDSPTGKSCILEIVNSSSITLGVNLYGSITTGTPIPQITASFTMVCIE